MPSSEFILFQSNFGDFSFQRELKGSAAPKDTTALLSDAKTVIRKRIYDFVPIDKKQIAALASKYSGKISSVETLCASIESLKPSKLEEEIAGMCHDARSPEFLLTKKCSPISSIGFSYFISVLFEKAFPLPNVQSQKASGKKEVRFAASTPNWQVVRKANLEAPEKKESFMGLVMMHDTITRKHFDFLASADSSAKTVSEFVFKLPERKSFGKISVALRSAISECLFSQLSPALQEHLAFGIFNRLGFSPYVSLETANSVYPELKIPKPKGNFKKKAPGI